jgi:hypothetical protein
MAKRPDKHDPSVPETIDGLERLLAHEPAGLGERLRRIGKECAPQLTEPFRSADHGDLLYHENGLPTER